jgi:hypothetical protein
MALSRPSEAIGTEPQNATERLVSVAAPLTAMWLLKKTEEIRDGSGVANRRATLRCS